MSVAVLDAPKSTRPTPRLKLAVLCHAIRWASIGWISWALVMLARQWGDKAGLIESYGKYLRLDLTALPTSNYVLSLGVIAADLLISTYVVVCIWQLFGHYLRGDIFSADAARALRRLGWAGVLAVAADMVARPLVVFILSMHLGPAAMTLDLRAQPNDLLHLLMALFVVALAEIHGAGVELADEHRQIV